MARPQGQRWVRINPISGMLANIPPTDLPLTASPDMANCVVFGTELKKRPGYTQWGSGSVHASERVMGVFSTQDESNVTHFFATSQTELKKYDTSAGNWTSAFSGPALTGGSEKLMDWDVSQNSVVFCQGENQVLRVPFTGTTYAILNTNCPAAYFMTLVKSNGSPTAFSKWNMVILKGAIFARSNGRLHEKERTRPRLGATSGKPALV